MWGARDKKEKKKERKTLEGEKSWKFPVSRDRRAFLENRQPGKGGFTLGWGLLEQEEVASDILRYFQSSVMSIDFPKHGYLLG